MSISDEHDLGGRLDQAFQAIAPRPAPVDQAVRQGRVIRVRRRLVAVAALAVVAAGIAVPVLLDQPASPPVLNQPRYPAVTVHPAGPDSPAGLIASGTAAGQPWRITEEKPGAGRGGPCFLAAGSRDCGPVSPAGRSDPVEFVSTSNGSIDAQYGAVSAAVSYVTVRLADGTRLTLHPVSVYGTRYVAYAAPLDVPASRVTAYSARGELASAIPFDTPGEGATIVTWLRPGQTGLARATHLVGSGRAGGRLWSVTAYVGPWGKCLVDSGGGGGCSAVSSPQGTSVMGSISGSPEVVYGTASADVQHLVITLGGGGSLRVRASAAGDQKFFAFALGHGQHAVRWHAYDAARHLVGSGGLKGM